MYSVPQLRSGFRFFLPQNHLIQMAHCQGTVELPDWLITYNMV